MTRPVLSLVHATQVAERREIVDVAELVERLGYHRLWMGQSMLLDTHQALGAVAVARPRVRIGSSVVLMPFIHPVNAAVTASSIATASDHPYVAGFGTSEPAVVERATGSRIEAPATYAREYLTIVRQLLEDGRADFEGRHFTCHHPLPAPLAGDVRLGLGVLRPGMARVAGAVADAAITWLCPRPYIADRLRPEMDRAAQDAGRPAPHVAAVVHVALTESEEDAVRLAESAVRVHVQRPHYVDMLRRSGLDVDPGDPGRTARQLVDTGTFVFGTPETVVDALAAFGDAGVDEVAINTLGAGVEEGPVASVVTVRRIAEAWRARATPEDDRRAGAAAG